MSGTRPTRLETGTPAIRTGCGTAYVIITPKGSKYKEVSAILGKTGGCIAGLLKALTDIITVALNAGVPWQKITKQLEGVRCPQDSDFIPSCPEALSRVIKSEWGEEQPEQ